MNAPVPAIYGALADVMADVGSIGKNKKNAQQGFAYRGIDDVYNSIHPLFAQHGVVCLPQVLERAREERVSGAGKPITHTIVRVRYLFVARDGSSVEVIVDGEGMDSADKSTSKALAIAHKYALFQVLMIPTEEIVDPDSETHNVRPRGASAQPAADTVTEAQVSQIMDLIEQSRDRDLLDKILKLVDAPALSKMRASLFDRVLKKLHATLAAESAKVPA